VIAKNTYARFILRSVAGLYIENDSHRYLTTSLEIFHRYVRASEFSEVAAPVFLGKTSPVAVRL